MRKHWNVKLARCALVQPAALEWAPWYSTSMAYLLSNRREQAYLWAERAYQESPNHPFALRALAMSAALVGKRARAHMAFQRFAPAYSRFLERTKAFMDESGNSKDFEKIVEAMRLASTSE